MVSLMDLWLPIVLSAVIVFIASSIIHMVLGFHKSDYKVLPGEDKIAAAMREEGVSPGYYTLPHCVDPKEMGKPEMLEKYNQGPVAFVTVTANGPPVMSKFLGLWFAFAVVISVFAAYLAGRTLGPGAEYLAVFRIAGTAAFLGYAASEPIASIWKAQPWGITIKHVFDGLVYALLTGGVFGWLWPS
ncbi:MAG: hypothetical protein V3T72_08995 [Thermoanaerobaculia bacterium]